MQIKLTCLLRGFVKAYELRKPGRQRPLCLLPLLHHRKQTLEYKEHPGGAVHEEIEPVQRADELPFGEHLELLHYMGWVVGGQPERKAEDYEDAPGQLVHEFNHAHIITHAAWYLLRPLITGKFHIWPVLSFRLVRNLRLRRIPDALRLRQ